MHHPEWQQQQQKKCNKKVNGRAGRRMADEEEEKCGKEREKKLETVEMIMTTSKWHTDTKRTQRCVEGNGRRCEMKNGRQNRARVLKNFPFNIFPSGRVSVAVAEAVAPILTFKVLNVFVRSKAAADNTSYDNN